MWLYRWLLRLSPGSLRRDYGAAMEEMFARRIWEARDAGMWRRSVVWSRELTGLLALALSERYGAAARLRRRYHQQLISGPKAGAMDIAAQEIRHAARRLVRTPVFTLAAALTLGLAIAANVAIFAVVYRVVINPLPYPQASRLILLDYGVPARNMPSGMTSMAWQLYFQLADRARTLEEVAVYNTGAGTLTGRGTPERLQIARATPSLLSVLRVSPALGRWFIETEGVTGGAPVAVLSHGLWSRKFGGDRAVVGRTLTLDGVPTEIVGVMPAEFSFPDSRVELWTAAQSTRANASFLFTLTGVARLRDGVTIDSARTEITALIADLSQRVRNQTGIVSAAAPLQDALVGRVATALWILLGSVGLVLLVACANVANLFLVRSETRQREVAVRRALGASQRGVARFFFTESALVALLGGAIGLGLAWVAVQLLLQFGPPTLPRLNEIRIDGVAMTFTIALTLVATVIFGTIPLLRLAPVGVSLHDNTRGQASSRGSHRARQVLMGAQVALALVLLLASGLMVRSFQKLRAIDLGFEPSAALTFSVGLPEAKYATRQAAVAVHRDILDRLSAIAGVNDVSTTTCLPLAGPCFGNTLLVDGEPFDPRKPNPWAWWRAVSADYTAVVGMRLLRGRHLDRSEVDRGEAVVVVNKAFADGYFPGESPIDRRVRSSRPPNVNLPAVPWLRIVGVVSNTPTFALGEPTPSPQLFMPMSIAGGPDIPREALTGPDVTGMIYVLRSSIPPSDLANAVRNAIDQVDPNLAIAQVRTLQDIVDRSSDQASFTMMLIAIAATVALLLGAIGIYGVVSYIVAQRTGEIGVRLAMGAEPRTVARMVLGQSAVVIVAGITVGLVAAFAGTQLIQSLLFGISPRDPAVFVATTLLLLGVAFVACWLPARRAARLSPLDALRAE